MTVALFLLGGLMDHRAAHSPSLWDQNLLAPAAGQRAARLDVHGGRDRIGGYYPDPKNAANDPTVLWPAGGVWAANGQPIVGTRKAAAPGDTVTVRYAVNNTDNIFNCMGTQNSSGVNRHISSTSSG